MMQEHASAPSTPIRPDPKRRRDTVHPVLVVVVFAAIVAAGFGAYRFVQPSHSDEPVAFTDVSSRAPVLLNDDQIIQALAFAPEDAPKGWSYTAVPKNDTTVGDAVVPTCGAQSDARPSQIGATKLLSGYWLAMQVVDVQHTTQGVADDFNRISDGSILDCIRGQVVNSLGPLLCSCTGLNVAVVPMAAPPSAPVTTYAYRFTIDLDGLVIVQADAYFIGDGRAEIALLFASQSGNFPSDAEANLVRRAIERLHDTPTTDKTA